MIGTYSQYLLKYIAFPRNRQFLLILSIVGIFISSFSLLVLQSTMGGLQNGLIKRSQTVEGLASIDIKTNDQKIINELKNVLKNNNISFIPEYEIELMILFRGRSFPVFLHGVDFNYQVPKFLESEKFSGVILGRELASELRVSEGSMVEFVSPMHTELIFEEVPRSVTDRVSKVKSFELPEQELLHAWVRLSFVQNLVQENTVNKIVLTSNYDFEELKRKLNSEFNNLMVLETWDEKHQSLLRAFKLETSVLVILFICMSLLAAVAIISGFYLFFHKLKPDLLAMWILGASQKKISKLTSVFLVILSFGTAFLGVLMGYLFLIVFDSYNFQIMPEIFVERKIPIKITTLGLLSSFLIPFLVSIISGLVAILTFKKEEDAPINRLRGF